MNLIDVTLRDGGHAVDFDWSIDLAKEYYKVMSSIPEVKFIELGYWKQSEKSDKRFYNLDFETVQEIVGNSNGGNVSIMIDYHYCTHDVSEYPTIDQNIIGMIRLCVRKEDMDDGLEFGKKLKQHTGLNVSLNIFNASNYTPDELIEITTKVSDYPFDYVYFADTHGCIEFPRDYYIFEESVKILRDSGKKLGMHLHDHSGKAIWNYRQLKGLGFVSSDTSVRGMGKGSGNLKLEFVIDGDSLISVAELIRKYEDLLTITPIPYELITSKYSLTDNYAKEAKILNMTISDFDIFCKNIIGLDRDSYNKELLTSYINE
jgi:4-hydroxy 2-oxovalerate aldolase